jgi:hypothetical protein
MFQPRPPSHIRLCGKKCEGFVSGKQEAMTEFRICLSSVVIGLLFEVAVSPWADDVHGTHCMPVFFSR